MDKEYYIKEIESLEKINKELVRSSRIREDDIRRLARLRSESDKVARYKDCLMKISSRCLRLADSPPGEMKINLTLISKEAERLSDEF